MSKVSLPEEFHLGTEIIEGRCAGSQRREETARKEQEEPDFPFARSQPSFIPQHWSRDITVCITQRAFPRTCTRKPLKSFSLEYKTFFTLL